MRGLAVINMPKPDDDDDDDDGDDDDLSGGDMDRPCF
jgi:hypothetical protein